MRISATVTAPDLIGLINLQNEVDNEVPERVAAGESLNNYISKVLKRDGS